MKRTRERINPYDLGTMEGSRIKLARIPRWRRALHRLRRLFGTHRERPDPAGVLVVVSRRLDGTLTLINGAARVDAARRQGVRSIEAYVYETLDEAAEARLYVELNSMRHG